MINLNRKSISEQLVDHYKEKIEQGVLRPGDEFPSERTLEKELGVSRKTISKVITALASMGYLFKEQGRTTYVTDSYLTRTALPTGKALGVQFATPESVYHPACAPLFMELCKSLEDSPYSLELIFDKSKDIHLLRSQIEEKRISGLFIFDSTDMQVEPLCDIRIPTVVFGSEKREWPKKRHFSYVAADAQQAICEATQYLAESGRKRIAFINGNENWDIDKRRKKNFCDTLAKMGLQCDPQLIADSHYEHKRTMASLKKILLGKPDAIIGADDMVARWAVEALRAKDISIPRQIAVIGFNDMQLYSIKDEIQLTTFILPSSQMAETAVREVLQRIETPRKKAKDHIFSMIFCKRTSA